MSTALTPSIRMRLPEVCHTLQCSRDHVYQLHRRGKLLKRNDGPRCAWWLRSEVEAFARGENPYVQDTHGKEDGQGAAVTAEDVR